MIRCLLPLLLLATACAEPVDSARNAAPESRLGPISSPLPGSSPQDHATVACGPSGCLVGREVGNSVRFSLLDAAGNATSFELPPAGPIGYNHPETRTYGDGWLVATCTWGAPMLLQIDPAGVPIGPAVPLDQPWPWGLWPDLAIGEDGRALAFWSTKTTPWWRLFDPADPQAAPAPQTWDLALPLETVDPPAAVAVPGGYVRGWTAKNGFVWQVRLLWVDLDGAPLGEPVIAAEGEGLSRGARPQLAADAEGNVAIAWRVWPDIGVPADGAFFRLYDPDQQPLTEIVQLDAGLGDRPTIEAVPDGWLIAWEEGDPHVPYLQSFDRAGLPLSEVLAVSESAVPAGRANLGGRVVDGEWSGFVTWEEVRSEGVDKIFDADVRVRPISLSAR